MSLPFSQALRLPILVAYNTKILSLKGEIIVDDLSFGSVRIGFSGAGSASGMRSIIENNGWNNGISGLNIYGGVASCVP